jgi:outer membrane protein TolC
MLSKQRWSSAKMELIDTKVEQLKASIVPYRALGGGWR